MKQRYAGCWLLLAPLVASAEGNAGVSFKAQLQPLFNEKCVFCHVTGAENGGLNLARSVSYANLVGAPSTESPLPRVTAGDPSKSYLMHKLQGTQASVGGNGDRMPRIDPPRPMDPAQLELVKTWILEGARNN